MKSLPAAAVRASSSVSGRVWNRERTDAGAVKKFRSAASGSTSRRFMPSSPARISSVKARYGLHSGSGERSSARRYSPCAAGMRISWERFSLDQEI